MKSIILTFVILLAGTCVFSQGIKFEKLSHEEAMEKAQEENKSIFIDCYTSWCGPCKKLDKEIFTQKKVGDFFNKNYVCIKVDMEKGEGIELGDYYRVRSYPTLLFLDSEGKNLQRLSGFSTAEKLIEIAKKVLNSNSKKNE